VGHQGLWTNGELMAGLIGPVKDCIFPLLKLFLKILVTSNLNY